MGRHGAYSDRSIRARLPRIGVSGLTVALAVVLVGAIALGVWWWTLHPSADPIDSDPVNASAVVVSSPTCPDSGQTVVRIVGLEPATTASLDGCGFSVDQKVSVQYLAGDPQQIRQAGTATGSERALTTKLLPIGILVAGLTAVIALGVLLVERRHRRQRDPNTAVALTDLQSRFAVVDDPGNSEATEDAHSDANVDANEDEGVNRDPDTTDEHITNWATDEPADGPADRPADEPGDG